MSTSDGTKTHKADGNISRMLENNYQEESAQRGWFSQLIRPADTDFIWYYALDFSQHGCMIVGEGGAFSRAAWYWFTDWSMYCWAIYVRFLKLIGGRFIATPIDWILANCIAAWAHYWNNFQKSGIYYYEEQLKLNYRMMPQQDGPMNQTIIRYLSMFAILLLVTAILYLYHRGALFSWNPVVITLQILGLLIMLWARITFGMRSFHFPANTTNGPLVTHGPYRFVRNPIYSAALLFIWAGISVHLSLANIALGLCVVLAFALRIACEEAFLHKQFPDYPAYAKRTARLIPFLL
jgi:protein-S-isoprenylcysteine O-methyltransferase Ste14